MHDANNLLFRVCVSAFSLLSTKKYKSVISKYNVQFVVYQKIKIIASYIIFGHRCFLSSKHCRHSVFCVLIITIIFLGLTPSDITLTPVALRKAYQNGTTFFALKLSVAFFGEPIDAGSLPPLSLNMSLVGAPAFGPPLEVSRDITGFCLVYFGLFRFSFFKFTA